MGPWMLLPLLQATPAQAAPPQIDLQAYTTWRREVRAALDEARAACPESGASLRVTLHVQPDGRPVDPDGSEPGAEAVGLPRTAGLSANERDRALLAAAASQRCFEERLAALTLPVPPGARGVTLPPLWFDFGSASPVPSEPARAPRLAPPSRDSAEVRDNLMAVIWAGEGAILACLPPAQAAFELRWIVARTGAVAAVEPVAGLDPATERCVQDVVRRWEFPALSEASEAVQLRFVVDPGV